MLNKKDHMNSLFDFYETLLTDKQREIISDYYRDDLSLTEIAEVQNTSKAAVHDMIKRCEAHLEDYESKLKLYSHHQKRMSIYQALLELNDEKVKRYVLECIETE